MFPAGALQSDIQIATAVLRTPPTGLQRPSGLQDYKTARTAGLLTATNLHSLVAPGGPADINSRSTASSGVLE